MSEIAIKLSEVCGNNIYTRADGHVLYDRITDALSGHDKVIVEFSEREIASESFLDEAIVEHYVQPIFSGVERKIILRGVTPPDQTLLRKIYEYRKRLGKKQAKKIGR